MSGRRGQARAAAAAADAEDPHNVLLELADADVDPVMGAIRFGMDSLMKIMNDTVPHCPAENEELKQELTEKMEKYFLGLVESELCYSQTNTIVAQIVEELELQDSPIDTKEFVDSVELINDLTNQRLAEYKAALTEEELKANPRFAQMQATFSRLILQTDISDVDMADAETEAEETEDSAVNLDDDDGESSAEAEVNQDPITKLVLENPVRNKFCRHIYGKDTILKVIKKNPRLRCPYMGCANPNYLKPTHLVEDPALTARVAGQPGPKQAKTSSTPTAGTSASSHKSKRGRGRRRR